MIVDTWPICARCRKKWRLEHRRNRWVWIPMCMHVASGIVIKTLEEPSQEKL